MKRKRPLKVFEAFAGIGAQATALKRLGINFEIVGICDWSIDAIICYDSIHHAGQELIDIPSYPEQLEYLQNYEFSCTSINPTNLKVIDKAIIEQLYVANKRSKNFGSINQLCGKDIPKTDLLVYSFPCQDLSTGGNSLGMSKGSGTRSSLLWEIERILIELNELNRLPEYLLMENVKTVTSKKYKPDLDLFLSFLSSIGYENDDCMVLNSLDFDIPQDRERAFIVSHLKKKIAVSKCIKKHPRNFNIFDFLRCDYENPILKMEADIAQLNRTPSREVMWRINGKEINENTTVRTITCNMDRTHTSALFKYSGAKGDTYRRLTIREAFLLMGFTEEEYERTQHLDFSYRKMNKLIGNSIVVNVLTEIFREMFYEKYEIPPISTSK